MFYNRYWFFRAWIIYSYNSSAICGSPASIKLGLFPFLQFAYGKLWNHQSSPFTSFKDRLVFPFSSSKIRNSKTSFLSIYPWNLHDLLPQRQANLYLSFLRIFIYLSYTWSTRCITRRIFLSDLYLYICFCTLLYHVPNNGKRWQEKTKKGKRHDRQCR